MNRINVYICGMKRNVIITVLIAVCLTAVAVFCINTSQMRDEAVFPLRQEVEISPEDDCIDLCICCKLSNASLPLTFTNRNNTLSGTVRTGSQYIRLLQKTNPDLIIKDGKITGIAPVRSFMLAVSNFPSGTQSKAHCFIRLCKLVI